VFDNANITAGQPGIKPQRPSRNASLAELAAGTTALQPLFYDHRRYVDTVRWLLLVDRR
jgi:hypothetical protein